MKFRSVGGRTELVVESGRRKVRTILGAIHGRVKIPEPIPHDAAVRLLAEKALDHGVDVSEKEARACLRQMVSDGILAKVKVSRPDGWSGPGYVNAPRPDRSGPSLAKAVLKGERTRRSYGRKSVCSQCGQRIRGGRHAKASNGHAKDQCDASLVKDVMSS